MAELDSAYADQLDALIERAGAAVARSSIELLGGTYGRRVVVIAGKGNNGNDGRVAARRLRSRGVRVEVVAPDHHKELRCDLVIDAAYGCGLSRAYTAPLVAADVPVLAVDIASGVDGHTGDVRGAPLVADRTVTFVALKPGLVLEPGAEYSGEVELIDLGMEIGDCATHLVTDADIDGWWPERNRQAHKWNTATWIIGGSRGMFGAPSLAVVGAQRVGAGYVRVSSPGAHVHTAPIEAVGHPLPAQGWDLDVAADIKRFGSVVIGPGLGRGTESSAALARLVETTDSSLVIDGDGLHGLSKVKLRPNIVLTPHDGEFKSLTGSAPGLDRIDAARQLAGDRNAVVLLKGPATVIAAPDGQVLVVTSGDQRLATAGSGDVLAGMIGALLAKGMPPLQAAAVGAHVHGRAARLAPAVGMVASDIAALIAPAIAKIRNN